MIKKILLPALCILIASGCSPTDSTDEAPHSPITNPPSSGAQNFNEVSSESHTIAIKQDGTLWTCGYNAQGQLGNGTVSDEYLPPAQIGSDSDWKTVSAAEAGFYSMAIKNDGSLWAWGTSTTKAMGLGMVEYTYTPTRVGTDNDWKAIYCSGLYALAIKNDGTLWGAGMTGQLGHGLTNTIDFTHFQQLNGSSWKYISAGQTHALGIKTDGSLWSWGFNFNGQLGNGTLTSNHFLYQIGTDTDWKQVSASGSISMALKNDGSLWSWGHNNYGQLGHGNTTDLSVPTQIGSSLDWKFIATGNINSFAVKTDGTLWGWGNFVRPGIGFFAASEALSYAPVKLDLSTDWDTVYDGLVVVAKRMNGENWCWGNHLTIGTAPPTEIGKLRPIIW